MLNTTFGTVWYNNHHDPFMFGNLFKWIRKRKKADYNKRKTCLSHYFNDDDDDYFYVFYVICITFPFILSV